MKVSAFHPPFAPFLHRRLRCAAGALCLCAAGVVSAADAVPYEDRPARDVERSVDLDRRVQGRGELRRVLIGNRDEAEEVPARRSLSADERRALHRSLRDAVEGAYPDERKGRGKP